MFTRRSFQQFGAASLMLAATPAPLLAKLPTDKRLIVIQLKGAMDGLHALVPYADANYQKLRPNLGLGRSGSKGTARGIIDIDGSFGLNSALKPLYSLYTSKDLLFIPAISTQYRQRSHFEAQDMLGGGGLAPYQQKTGWLNRAITQINSSERIGLTLGPTIPLIMRGKADIRTWSESKLPEVDEGFLDRVNALYENDPIFHKAFNLAQADSKQSGAKDNLRLGNGRLELSMQAALTLLKQKDGPRLAVIEANGWDTHFGQERRLQKLFTELANSVALAKSELGPLWQDTAILVVSEFGRTAAENGSKGTDHGTGGLAILAGGTVKGGQIAGAWPGLSKTALFQARDLAPANAMEGVFKSVLTAHLGLSEAKVADYVFPGMNKIKPMTGLF